MIEQFAPIHDDMVTMPNGSIMPLKLAARGQRGWGVDRTDSETERLKRVEITKAIEVISAAIATFENMGPEADEGDFVAVLCDISEAWPVVAAWIKTD